jgi:uncharacterized protein (TIGR03546 family)
MQTMANSKKSERSSKNKIYELLNKTYERFLKIRGEPSEIALGFALGLLVGMTPALGFHMVIAIFFATLFKWNKISAALAVWITNPITAPLIYSITYMLGARILGIRKSYEPTDEVSSTTFIDMIKKTPEILAAMTIGGFIIGLPLSLLGCYIAYTAIRKYQEDIKNRLAQQRLKLALKHALRKEKRKQKALNKKNRIQIQNKIGSKTMNKNEKLYTYKCQNCHQTLERKDSKNTGPECCGTPMEKIKELPVCQSTATAEHARSDEMAEPCDDGREGKI